MTDQSVHSQSILTQFARTMTLGGTPSHRYVPTVRAGFWTSGMNIDSNKVKTGLKTKIAEFSAVKTGFRSHFRQISSKIYR